MWVLFDLNGTLLDPAVLLDPPELPVAALDEANMMAMITVIAGAETTFKPLFDAALRRHLQRAGRDPDEAAQALEKLAQMPAFPEVPAALQALRDAGFRLAVLTQSAAEASEQALTHAGIREHFEHVLSAPEFGAFKPEDLAYHAAIEKLGTAEAWFVAGHWWDVAGAAYGGLKTAWVSRTDIAYPGAMPAPEITGADVAEVAAKIVRSV
jgi:2-haloacid dehalogenase